MANTHSLDLELGSTQYASGSDKAAYDITSNFTIECWVKPESLSSDGSDRIIVDRYYDGSTRSWQFGLYRATGGDNTKLLFYCGNAAGSAGQTHLSETGAVAAGSWQHIAVVFDDSANLVRFFVNGVAKGTSAKTDALGTNNQALTIGCYLGSGYYYDGLVDEVRIWSTNRSSTDISDYKDVQLVGDETNLVGYWKLNNGYTDSTSNANTLTPSGSPVFSTDVPFAGSVVYTLDASVTEFALTMVNTILTKSLKLIASVRTYTYSTVNAIFTKSRTLTASVTAYTYTTVNTVLTKSLKLIASVTGYTYTTVNAIFSVAHTLVASVTSYTLTMFDSVFTKSLQLITSVTDYTLTTVDTLFTKTINLIAQVTSYIFTTYDAILYWPNYSIFTQQAKGSTAFTNSAKGLTAFTNSAKETTPFTNSAKGSTAFSNSAKTSTTFTNQSKT